MYDATLHHDVDEEWTTWPTPCAQNVAAVKDVCLRARHLAALRRFSGCTA